MSRTSEIRDIALEILSDNAPHKLEEIKAVVVRRGIETSPDNAIIRATLYQMKKRGDITSSEPGVYQLQEEKQLEMPLKEEALSIEELETLRRRIDLTIQSLKTFNWLKCSDAELKKAREKATIIKYIGEQAKQLDK